MTTKCGAAMKITPETLTDDLIAQQREHSRTQSERDIANVALSILFLPWIQRAEARRRICDAINARTERGGHTP
jgi:TnpA family transposase